MPFYAHNDACTQVHKCSQFESNGYMNSLFFQKIVPPTKASITATPVTTVATTKVHLDHFCKGKKSGNYPDPTRCDGFISCSGGMTYHMDCPAKLWYNVKKDQCDYHQNVNCKCKYGGHTQNGAR